MTEFKTQKDTPLPSDILDDTPEERKRFDGDMKEKLEENFRDTREDFDNLNTDLTADIRAIPLENTIMNAAFWHNQRAASYASPGVAYTLDRFEYVRAGQARCTITQSTDVPDWAVTTNSWQAEVTTRDSQGASDRVYVSYHVEGFDFKQYEGNMAMASFNIKSPKAGILCLAVQNGVDRLFTTEYTVAYANTWERISVPINFNYSGGTWDYINGLGIKISWVLEMGSDRHGPADQWVSSNTWATPNQENCMDVQGDKFLINEPKLEPGLVKTPFRPVLFETDLAMCQRYYEHSYDYGIYPGTATANGSSSVQVNAVANANHNVHVSYRYKEKKRAVPTVSVYDAAGNGGSGAAARVTMTVGDNIAGTIANSGMDAFEVSGSNGVASTTRSLIFHAEIDA